MSVRLDLVYLLLGITCGLPFRSVQGEVALGPLYQEFRSPLTSGERTEALGPLYYSEHDDGSHSWAVPPLFYFGQDKATDSKELDIAYPLLTYDRFGPEYRFQICQLLAFAGGQSYSETNVHRFTLFPVFFWQRSGIPERNYTAVLPVYGRVQNRLFRDEVKFILLPLYVQSRKKDVVTDNYVYPFFHLRHGNGLRGWQFWPILGREHKEITHATNMWGDVETIGGHDKSFVLWPFYVKGALGIGTTNLETQEIVFPLYSKTRSAQRESTTYFWPLGYTRTVDRVKKYEEWDAPWPLIVFAHGEGKTTRRVWPFFSEGRTPTLENNWYLWPVYKYNRVHASPLDRRRTRILFFLYSDIVEKNTETGAAGHRVDFFPFYTFKRGLNGNEQLQVLTILEPFLPNSKSIERNFSPLWALWRSQENAQTKARSQSLLWNLYRRESSPEGQRWSALFGLLQHQSGPKGSRWGLFHIPVDKTPKAAKH